MKKYGLFASVLAVTLVGQFAFLQATPDGIKSLLTACWIVL
jgi:hypothetical protein